MALREDLTTVEHTESKDGRVIVRKFKGTHNDYYTSPNMPVVGSRCPWDSTVNVVETHFYPDGTFDDITKLSTYNGDIDVVYAQWDTYSRIRPDEASSWELWFTSALVSHTVDQYYNYNTGVYDTWKTVYQAGDGNEDLEPPDLLKTTVETEFHVIAYGSDDRPKLMMDVLGTVNNSGFIRFMFTNFYDALGKLAYTVNVPATDAQSINDDAGVWKCTQADQQPAGTNAFMYEFTFVWSGPVDIWNTPFGITTDKYKPVDYKVLFSEIAQSTFDTRNLPNI